MDFFYDLEKPTIAKVKALFRWGYPKAIRTHVDMLDFRYGPARRNADKPFEEIVALIDKRSAGFFRVIHREKDLYTLEKGPVLEVGIRDIMVGDVEYFIFMFLPIELKDKLLAKYEFCQL